MGLFEFFKPRDKGNAGSIKPVAAKGSQRTYDTTALPAPLPAFYGLQQPQDLDSYRTYYLTNWLARRAVNALVRLTLSEITTRSENEELDQQVREFNRRINLAGVLASMLRQFFTYGATYSEIVFDSYPQPSDVLGIHVVDSRSMRLDLDPFGKVRRFIQLPQYFTTYTNAGSPIEIAPETMLHFVRDPLGDYPYGHSVLQAIMKELKSSDLLESAMVKAGIRAVTGQDLFSYEAAEGESSDEAKEAVDALVSNYNQCEPGEPLFASGAGNWQRLGQQKNNPTPMTRELEQILAAAISGCDLTPAAVGLAMSVVANEAAEQRIVLMSGIESIQSQICEQLNSKLYRVLSDVWNTEEIYVEMQAPILLSEKERAEKTTIDINNSGIKAKMGVINGQQAAQELGYDELADEGRFEKWLESGQTLQESRNPADKNVTQQDSKTIKDNSTEKQNINQENNTNE